MDNSLFDLFYEKFLTQLMGSENPESEVLSGDFMKLSTDIERVDYIVKRSKFLSTFEITQKCGVKSSERSAKYREEGNKLFQNDQSMQAILFYNKAIAYAPHPDLGEYIRSDGNLSQAPNSSKVKFQDDMKGTAGGKRRTPGKYESLALCYANRSAALRKLCQYEDCLKDIARASRFGYPKENLYKLWERKGKCYQGLKKYEMASKCLRQSLSC